MLRSLDILPIKVFKRNQLKLCDVESILNCYTEWDIYIWYSEVLWIDYFCCGNTLYRYNVKCKVLLGIVTSAESLFNLKAEIDEALYDTKPTIYDQLFV